MIDIHCHVLPDVDDGAVDLEQSLKMVREAVADGIGTIVATPHHMNGVYINHKEHVVSKVAELNDILEKHNIPVSIFPSQEIRIYENLVNDVINQEILSLDPHYRYILLELPSQSVPHYLERLVFDLRVRGVTPIIPHPERNTAIRDNPQLLYRAVKSGALAQVTAVSVVGGFGKNIEKFTRELIEHGLVHMIASDAHNTGVRGLRLSEAYDQIRNFGGTQLADDFKNNVRTIFQGQELWVNEPSRLLKKKKLFGLI